MPRCEFLGHELLLGFDAEEVVDVVQLAVLDEQCVAAEAGAVREDHPGGVGGDVDVGDDLVGPATDVDRDAFGDLARFRGSRRTGSASARIVATVFAVQRLYLASQTSRDRN